MNSSKPAMKGVITMNTELKKAQGINQKPTREQGENMKKVKEQAEAQAEAQRKQAEAQAEAQRKQAEAQRKENENPEFTQESVNVTKCTGFNFNLFVEEDCKLLFEDYFNQTIKINKGEVELILKSSSSDSRELNKNNYIRSFNVIYQDKNKEKEIITIKRTYKPSESKFNYNSLVTVKDNKDKDVLTTTHLGKNKLGLNYDEDKSKTEKKYFAGIDEVIKFVENYSTQEFKDKNMKKVRCNLKEIKTLLELIDTKRK